jgi:hypothetical protein
MGQILSFPHRRPSNLQKTEALLKQAQASGHQAAAQFEACRDAMDWARTFHDRSQTAMEMASLDEMIRVRDALARDWTERYEGALKVS